MAQVTELQPNALPGVPHLFLPKEEALIVDAELVGISSSEPTFIGVSSSKSTFIFIQAGAEVTIFAGNDFDITVQDLRKSSDNSFKNDADLTVKLLNLDDTQILAPVSLPSDGGATGGYRVTISGDTFNPATDSGRRIRTVIESASGPAFNSDQLETIQIRG